MLKLNDDSWFDDSDVLRQLANEYYSSIFTKDDLLSKDPYTRGLFYKFSNDEIESFKTMVMEEEIKKVVFDMDPLKAPGVNGIHATFYQKN